MAEGGNKAGLRIAKALLIASLVICHSRINTHPSQIVYK